MAIITLDEAIEMNADEVSGYGYDGSIKYGDSDADVAFSGYIPQTFSREEILEIWWYLDDYRTTEDEWEEI